MVTVNLETHREH